jgi:hypothetical protein
MLVPLHAPYWPLGSVDRIATPGAAMVRRLAASGAVGGSQFEKVAGVDGAV